MTQGRFKKQRFKQHKSAGNVDFSFILKISKTCEHGSEGGGRWCGASNDKRSVRRRSEPTAAPLCKALTFDATQSFSIIKQSF